MNTTTAIHTPVELHAGAALFQWYATAADTDGAGASTPPGDAAAR